MNEFEQWLHDTFPTFKEFSKEEKEIYLSFSSIKRKRKEWEKFKHIDEMYEQLPETTGHDRNLKRIVKEIIKILKN